MTPGVMQGAWRSGAEDGPPAGPARLVILGAGGFGRECLDVVVAMNNQGANWDFVGFLDDREPDAELMRRLHSAWLGPTQAIAAWTGAHYCVGVSDASDRRRLVALADDLGLVPATLIHPSATAGQDVQIGEGSVICSHVSLTTHIRIGRHVHVNLNATVGHDTSLADFSQVHPGATVSGSVRVGSGATIGTNAAVLQGVNIGADAFVGAGGVVLSDVAAGAVVVGVPAVPIPR